MAVERFGAEGSRAKLAVADLILLSLQLCLGSDSRHVPWWECYPRGVFWRGSRAKRTGSKKREEVLGERENVGDIGKDGELCNDVGFSAG